MASDGFGFSAIRGDVAFVAQALRDLGARVLAYLMHCADVAHQRRQLARLDHRALKDFGISRADALEEASRSFFDVPESFGKRGPVQKARNARAAAGHIRS